ncbi:MAG: hypothetical protein R3C56_32160 [Pirellulaceae bacterium]
MRSIPASFTLLLILLGSLMPQKGSSAEPLTFPWGSARPAFPEAVQRASAASYHVLSTTVRHNASPALAGPTHGSQSRIFLRLVWKQSPFYEKFSVG